MHENTSLKVIFFSSKKILVLEYNHVFLGKTKSVFHSIFLNHQ